MEGWATRRPVGTIPHSSRLVVFKPSSSQPRQSVLPLSAEARVLQSAQCQARVRSFLLSFDHGGHSDPITPLGCIARRQWYYRFYLATVSLVDSLVSSAD